MAEIRLDLDPVVLREATSQAIMGTLTAELRAQVIQASISNLLNARTGSYGSGSSLLQQAFDSAVIDVARTIAKEMVASDPTIKAQVGKLLRDTADKVLSADPEKLAAKMADAFVASCRKEY